MTKLDQLRALREAKAGRKPKPFEDAARGRDVERNTPEASGTARKAPSGASLGAPSRNSVRASPNPRAKPEPKQGAFTTRSPALSRDKTTGSRLRSGRTDQAAGDKRDEPAATISKRGRPKIADPTKMSRRTIYRRKAEGTL